MRGAVASGTASRVNTADQPRRQFSARLEGGAILADSGKRWSLHSGAPVTTRIWGINGDRPIRLVIEHSSLKIADRTPAIAEHAAWMGAVVGVWSAPTIDASGLSADLAVVDDEMLPEARRVKALLAGKVPLQASIGVDAPDGEANYVLLTASETINGRAINPADSRLPTYVLRNGKLAEASVLLFGADSSTGPRLGAIDSLETSMSDRLKTLLAKHGDANAALVAKRFSEGDDDAAIERHVAHAAELGAMGTKLSDAERTISTLTAERDQIKADLAKATKGNLPGGGEGEEQADAPVTLAAALKQLYPEHCAAKLTMPQRLADVRKRFPTIAK